MSGFKSIRLFLKSPNEKNRIFVGKVIKKYGHKGTRNIGGEGSKQAARQKKIGLIETGWNQ